MKQKMTTINTNKVSRIAINYRNILISFLLLFTALILFISLRGITGNPDINELNTPKWTSEGPLELSPERGRYALMYSLIESKSFYFPLEVARFALPDLGYYKGNYVSLFAPAVSFIVAPGYVLGKAFGASQVGTFAVVALFAVLNCALIYKISRHVGANFYAALIAFFIFMFGTPAYTYAVTLYQHHISTFIILLAIYLAIKYENFVSLGIIWFLCALSLSVDYPNLFMMLPIGVYALGKIVQSSKTTQKYVVKIKWLYLFTFLFAVAPAIFFFWFNKNSYGSPFQLAGAVTQVKDIDENGNPAETNFTANKPKDLTQESNIAAKSEAPARNIVGYFNTRNMLNGFYLLFLSPDRGTISFAPIVLLGLVGIVVAYLQKNKYVAILTAVFTSNVLVYTMWGDPWGGWAFGARYLIPGYAILAILASVVITSIKKRYLLVPIMAVYLYSAYVNCAGAITSSMNPPKVEVLALEALSGTEQKYTVERNLDMLRAGSSKSFVFNTYLKDKMTARQFFTYLYGAIVLATGTVFGYYILNRERL